MEPEAELERSLRSPWIDWIQAEKAVRYRWTRFFLLRLLGLLYLMGFWILVQQGLPLIGHDGLLPADRYAGRVIEHFGSRSGAFWQLPSVFWLGISDRGLLGLAWVGVVLSLLVLFGFANAIVMALLWALYMSFVHVGQLWYGYGWEIQLLETGFLAIFLCSPLDPRPFPTRDPPQPVIWLYRWLIFRIMLGAGLIKIRGDECWRDLTCLYYHYETQPIPNPLSPIFHAFPHWLQRLSVLYNHLSELVVPFFVFAPRRVRHVAGGLLVSFQVLLILSGNLAFLNWLTLVPIIACFDDSLLERLVPRRLREKVEARVFEAPPRPQRVVVWGLVMLIGGLSFAPVMNLLSPDQVMNTEFNAFALVNTYGAFGSVGRDRDEIIFEGTSDAEVNDATRWKAYEFKCKPGDPDRRPCLMSPYHYRIDWQIWFAAMTTPDEAPWTVNFVWKLLHNDRGTRSLLGNDPFPETPPRFIRATLYRYRFARLGEKGWWRRERLGPWLPALSVDDPRIKAFLVVYGWMDPAEAGIPEEQP